MVKASGGEGLDEDIWTRDASHCESIYLTVVIPQRATFEPELEKIYIYIYLNSYTNSK